LATFRQTYQQQLKWHLIFPYADANLRKYWDDRKTPNFNETTVFWSLRQMCGIAEGLRMIRFFRVTIPLGVAGAGAGGVRVGDGARLSVDKGEELFGRHGDLKPENILWFQNDPASIDGSGVLKIADFGLGRFHGLDSRSKIDPKTVNGTESYEPPEVKLGLPVSRAYDIWSLGCLYLEFATWLLKGADEVDLFADRRAKESTKHPNLSDDCFYTIVKDPESGVENAEVREGVNVWVSELHRHDWCSDFIHDLLNLITMRMLIIHSKDRINAHDLEVRLKSILGQAGQDKSYLLGPRPRPHSPDSALRVQSTSIMTSTLKVSDSRPTVRFAERNAAATPTKSPTWSTIP
jgi:serine/threonine protein kinase